MSGADAHRFHPEALPTAIWVRRLLRALEYGWADAAADTRVVHPLGRTNEVPGAAERNLTVLAGPAHGEPAQRAWGPALR